MNHISIREVKSIDYKALAEFNANFQNYNGSIDKWLNRFKYWWDDNPAFDESWVRGFVLLDTDKIVGFVGSFPTFFKTRNEIIKAFNGTTWRVLKPYRKYSIDLWAKNREISNKCLSFNTTPTEDVIKMITRLKYFKYPWGDEKFSYIIGDVRTFSSMLPSNIPIRLRLFVSYVLKLVQKFFLSGKKTKFIIREGFDNLSDINDLWSRTEKQYDFTNLRNAISVEWYSQGKSLKRVYKNGEIIAYSINLCSKHSKKNVRTITIVDLWYDKKEDLFEIMRSLVKYDYKVVKSDKEISAIRYPHFSPQLTKAFTRLKLYSKSTQNNGYIRIPQIFDYKLCPNNSYFSLLQGDFGV